MTTPKLGADELATGQAQKEVTTNEALRRIEQFSAYGVVKSLGDNAPPGSPVDGDAYVIGGAPTGLWAGHAHDVAFYKGTSWEFIDPYPGLRVYVLDEVGDYRYIGGSPDPWINLEVT